MNTCQKYFSACALALLTQAAFAQSAPDLGAASGFAALAGGPAAGAVTCTTSDVTGDVGVVAPGTFQNNNCTITGTVDPNATQAYSDFLTAYDAFAAVECVGTPLTGTLAGVTLTPGVYCFDAAAVLTGTLTLDGGSDDTWLFKIGATAVGALTATDFSVVMGDGAEACNVVWWVDADATLTRANFNGTILAGADITVTGLAGSPGEFTFNGNALAGGDGSTSTPIGAVTLTDTTATACEGGTVKPPKPQRQRCDQGVGNGSEGCDPGNSNQDNFGSNPFTGSSRSNDELGGTPGNPGRKGGNRK